METNLKIKCLLNIKMSSTQTVTVTSVTSQNEYKKKRLNFNSVENFYYTLCLSLR